MGRRRESPETPVASAQPLVATFNGLRDELVSTLAYMLGSRDDAQDVAQEAFIKCWRARASVPDVLNLRAWIFRVALNAARDHQRSGWSKRAKPLVAEEATVSSRAASVSDQMVEDEQV